MTCVPSLPNIELPQSQHAVGVSIIDTTARLSVPSMNFVQDHIPGHDYFDVADHSFFIEHPSGANLIFDLGLRTDFEQLAPAIVIPLLEQLETSGGSIAVEKDVATILTDEGVDLNDIDAIIWSHWHADHSGDPSTFPNTTALVVGPGFEDAWLPGYPANPQGSILESDYQGRALVEMDFESHEGALKIGGFPAIDYFGDGSFYLLDSPGHTIGHMAALARTTPTTFILLGGDTCHHGGSMRPSKYVPLPHEVSPSPFSDPPFLEGTVCPVEVLVDIHPYHARDAPFYQNYTASEERNLTQVVESVGSLIELDALEDVFVITAHDATILDVVDFFPKQANDWKAKGWKEDSQWRFLEDFKGALNSTEPNSTASSL